MFFLTLRGVSFGSCQSVRNGRNGFTLVEILVVIAIILILAALIFPNCGMLINRAESVLCTGKLRNLWVTFSNHLDDGTGWPQLPSDIPIGSVAEQQWWLSSTSNSMGLTASDWNCRSIARSQAAPHPRACRGSSRRPALRQSRCARRCRSGPAGCG